jgi:hypothetical protein
MWARSIVILPPRLDDVPGISQANEPVPVKAFVAESSLEAFDKGVLDGLAGLDEAQSGVTPVWWTGG